MQTKCIGVQNYFPGNIYVFKVNNRNTRKRYNFMFKVNGKNTRMRSFWCSYCQLWTYFTAFYSVSIVSWVVWNHKIIIQHSQHLNLYIQYNNYVSTVSDETTSLICYLCSKIIPRTIERQNQLARSAYCSIKHLK